MEKLEFTSAELLSKPDQNSLLKDVLSHALHSGLQAPAQGLAHVV